MNWIKILYKEGDDPSYAETILFYLSVIFALYFIGKIYCDGVFKKTALVLFIPTIYWMFLRASRKDMRATGTLPAGALAAIGGAIVGYLLKP